MCLNMLQSRKSRREEPLDTRLPDPIISAEDGAVDPEQQALLAEGVGLALLVVLDTLAPAERIAFVLHDMFAVPFDQIAPIVRLRPQGGGAAPSPGGAQGSLWRAMAGAAGAASVGPEHRARRWRRP